LLDFLVEISDILERTAISLFLKFSILDGLTGLDNFKIQRELDSRIIF
jgi:hypothetical protein